VERVRYVEKERADEGEDVADTGAPASKSDGPPAYGSR
jgi:hypothetical protein